MTKLFRYIKIATLLSVFIIPLNTKAQMNPLGAQYYFNKYLGNPAFAGEEDGMSLFLGIRKQMAGIPGAPQDQSITGQYRFGKVGLGLNFNNEKTGLLRQTRTVATYAYHLPVNNLGQLHFGISIGAFNERISEQDIIGTGNDPSIANLNKKRTLLDGDFGVAYTNQNLTLQAALPSLNNIFNKDVKNTANINLLNAAIAYKIDANTVQLEPRVGFRAINGTDNIIDAGSRIGFLNNLISAFAMYHSTNAVSVGFGALTLKETLAIQGVYTTETSALRGNSNGNFELNVKYRLF